MDIKKIFWWYIIKELGIPQGITVDTTFYTVDSILITTDNG